MLLTRQPSIGGIPEFMMFSTLVFINLLLALMITRYATSQPLAIVHGASEPLVDARPMQVDDVYVTNFLVDFVEKWYAFYPATYDANRRLASRMLTPAMQGRVRTDVRRLSRVVDVLRTTWLTSIDDIPHLKQRPDGSWEAILHLRAQVYNGTVHRETKRFEVQALIIPTRPSPRYPFCVEIAHLTPDKVLERIPGSQTLRLESVRFSDGSSEDAIDADTIHRPDDRPIDVGKEHVP